MDHNLPKPVESFDQVRASNDTKTVEGMIKEKLSISAAKISKVTWLQGCLNHNVLTLLIL